MPANRSVRTFTVLPHLPERLQTLQTLAYNIWWCWNHEAVSLFRRIDVDLWEKVDHNPVKMLGTIDQQRLELLDDDGFLAHLNLVQVLFDTYMNASTWFDETYTGNGKAKHKTKTPLGLTDCRIAYFSAEFGLHESIPVYSGGLGVLAGDHLKAASDLGLPLVGVGLMYREGYFRQYLNVDGWQQERYSENDFFNLPLILETHEDGSPLLVSVPFPGREVWMRIWRIQVGRVPLYLLDTNIPQNNADDKQITSRLYGGDINMRIQQEMILGIGGVRALRALDKPPTVCHMNEGHSAFCTIERIRILMEEQSLDFATARDLVIAGTVFTTHTPVPAGNDKFSPQLIDHYFSHYWPMLKIDRNEFLGLGRENPRDGNEDFCMTVLAIRLANSSNGVSRLHGSVSRKMWRNIWPELPLSEIPITSITNGVHTSSWVSADMTQLYDRYLGIQWQERPFDPVIWKRVENIPDAELWRTHERRRERLVAYARRRLKQQLKNRGAPPAEIARADEVLDPEALTIGFARRFATYKRGTLLFRDLDRLAAIINAKDRPVQIIFAGKAHPKDHPGKELIQEIQHVCRRPEFRRRMVFIEDYDISVARYLVQGVDVWLNNPRRPYEASGTSGMKVNCNGGLNLSILDGWWCEGYQPPTTEEGPANGWAIGAGEEYADLVYQDEVESRAIYDLFEEELVPLFYSLSSDGLPRGWLRMMKRSMMTLCPVFSTGRMVAEYMERCYYPAAQRTAALSAEGAQRARTLAQWRRGMLRGWSQVKIENVEATGADPMHVGSALQVKARVFLGALSPDDVEVQLVHGRVDSFGDIPEPLTAPMSHNGDTFTRDGGRGWIFHGTIPCQISGQHGYLVRVLPRNADLPNQFEPGLVCWG